MLLLAATGCGLKKRHRCTATATYAGQSRTGRGDDFDSEDAAKKLAVADLCKEYCMMEDPDDFIGPVNLGNPHELTVSELAQMVLKLTGSKSKLVQVQLPQDDPTRRKPDISLAQRELGWKPEVSVEEGLKRTITEFKERLRAEE